MYDGSLVGRRAESLTVDDVWRLLGSALVVVGAGRLGLELPRPGPQALLEDEQDVMRACTSFPSL
jgi:hypothetical protein